MLINLLKTYKVPLKLEFICSPGFSLQFPGEHRFIEADYSGNKSSLIIKQISADLKVVGSVYCYKDYSDYNTFTLQTCLESQNLPTIIDIRKWERAKDEEEFLRLSVL